MGLGKGVAAFDVAQVCGGMGPQRLSVGQQEVEGAVRRDAPGQFAQRMREFLHAGQAGMGLPELLKNPAEGLLAVGVAYRMEVGMQFGSEALEISVVGKDPVAAPQFTHEGVAVLQAYRALRGLADVGDDVAALDRLLAYQLGDGRVDGALVADEVAQALVFEEGDAPAVRMVAGIARPLGEPRKAEAHVGGRVAVHSKQLAHGGIVVCVVQAIA